MSPLIRPQEEKKTTATGLGKLPVDHEYPPQEQAFLRGTERAALSLGDMAEDVHWQYLVPPQEEKADTSSPAKSNIDRVVERLEQQLNERAVQTEPEYASRDELLRARQAADAVRAGVAGVTGEDLIVAEDKKIV